MGGPWQPAESAVPKATDRPYRSSVRMRTWEEHKTPPLWLAAIGWLLVLSVVAGSVFLYRHFRPCWPWEDTTTIAGGTFCDGEPARFTID